MSKAEHYECCKRRALGESKDPSNKCLLIFRKRLECTKSMIGNFSISSQEDVARRCWIGSAFLLLRQYPPHLLGDAACVGIEGVLCSRMMQTPEGVIRRSNDLQKAVHSRDALARHAYHTVFCHVVARTNESIRFRENLFAFVLVNMFCLR